MSDRQIINVGSTVDDGTGDLLRDAFNKTNTNFEALWEVTAVNSNVDISGDSISSTGDLTISPTDGLLVAGSVTINSDSEDRDFVVNGNGVSNVLFVDASTGRVGVKNNTPTAELDITGNAKVSGTTTTETLTVNGTTTIGADVSQIVNFNSRVGTSIEPNGNQTIGSLINRWDNGYFTNLDVSGLISGSFSGSLDPSITITNDVNNANVTTQTFEVSTSAEIETLLVRGNISMQGSAVSFTDTVAPLSSVGSLGDAQGLVAFDENYVYYCSADYDGSTNIWKRISWSVDTW